MFLSRTISGRVLPRLAGNRAFSAFPAVRVFDYDSIRKNINVGMAISSVEKAFGKLAEGKVDVPIPMHIGINESESAGPGDCHIKGGYVEGALTWTVKLANVSFYKNLEKGLPPGCGIFVVCDATNGAPLGVFQENRYLTDLRTGAAGAVCVKHFVAKEHTKVCFIGTGAIAMSMARASSNVHKFTQGFAFGLDEKMSADFAKTVESELGYPVKVCTSVDEALKEADVIFTQTTGAAPVLSLSQLQPHVTIIASGSDQPSKNEIPAEVQANGKLVCDLVRQCALVGELRTALKDGALTKEDVYAEIGEVVNGTKKGREGNEMIVCDLTGTGAQDAAIGQVAWDIMKET